MNANSDVIDNWQRAIENARLRAPASFDQWFSGVQFDGIRDGVLALTARDEFVRDWIKTHFLQALLGDLEDAHREGSLRVNWRISSSIQVPIGTPAPPESRPLPNVPNPRVDAPAAAGHSAKREVDPKPAHEAVRDEHESLHSAARENGEKTTMPPRQEPLATAPAGRSPAVTAGGEAPQRLGGDPINPKHTFPNFVVGPSNELAYAAAVASAGSSGPRYNPLFICGGTGLGKTHLAHSIAHCLLEQQPNTRILYVSAERFTNEFIEALQHHKMEQFRRRYRRSCDALLVDDIQFLAGREQTQEEFFHTFNALKDVDKPIVVTSDKYPQDLQRMPERLISRFSSGLVADVQTPALETRVAILKKKAELEGIELDDQVAVLLAQSIKSNVRELEGTLIRMAARSSLLGRPIDLEFTKAEISIANPIKAQESTVEDIQRAVCNHFSFSNAELLSKDRHKSVAFARQVAMYLCRQRLKCSFPELGRAFGNRDHTTVMSACRRVESLRRQDPQVDAHLQAIENKLASDN